MEKFWIRFFCCSVKSKSILASIWSWKDYYKVVNISLFLVCHYVCLLLCGKFSDPRLIATVSIISRWRGSDHICSRTCGEAMKRLHRKRKMSKPQRKKCPAVAKKDEERSRRNSIGILVSFVPKLIMKNKNSLDGKILIA